MIAAARNPSPAAPPLLSELLRGFAPVPPKLDRPVTGMTLNSREARPGDVFVALSGTCVHGLEYAPAARRAGAALALYEPTGAMPIPSDLPALPVPDLGRRLGVIAGRLHGHPGKALALVGVTGTDGKTSTAHYLAQALHDGQRGCALLGTVGYGYPGSLEPASHTTPDALQLQSRLAGFAAQGARCAVMEVSSHALDQHRVSGLRFDTAVLTNLSRDHLDYHGTVEAYAEAKRNLFRIPGLRAAVLNTDDPFGRDLLRILHPDALRVAYGLAPPPAEQRVDRWLSAKEVRADDRGLSLRLEGSWGSGILHAPVLGRFNAYNLLAAAGVMLGMDRPLEEVIQRLSRARNAPGRMERFGGGKRPLAVVDFAHTPAALNTALKTLREHTQGRVICVFGCGGDRDVGKRALMGEAAARRADAIWLTDDNPRHEDGAAIINDIRAGIRPPASAHVERDRATAIAAALDGADAGDIVLIAGKGHEDYQQIGDERISYSDRELLRRLCAEAAP